MKKILCLLITCFCFALCSCSSGTVIIQEGKYCLSGGDAYIIVSNFDPDGEDINDVEEDEFIGTCEVQFFNYDFSDLYDLYETDMSEQFVENSSVFTFCGYDGDYTLVSYVTDSRSDDYGTVMSLPLTYLPEENTLYLSLTEEKFILQTDD